MGLKLVWTLVEALSRMEEERERSKRDKRREKKKTRYCKPGYNTKPILGSGGRKIRSQSQLYYKF